MLEDRVAVLVHSGGRISSIVELSWKNQIFQVWVEEISGQWYPEFLKPDESELGSHEWMSEDEQAPPSLERKSNECMSDSSDTCMGNEKDVSPSKADANVQVSALHGELFSPKSVNEVREKVGPGSPSVNLGEQFSGPAPDPPRPSYITTRPKRNIPHIPMTQSSVLPDLNQNKGRCRGPLRQVWMGTRKRSGMR
ncbi:hypothetical protein Hanom_Chr09g00791341 [Helianthus anomalus]